MANHDAFRAKVQELLRLSSLTERDLAIWMGYAYGTFSRFLNKPGLMKPVHVEIMVERMAEHQIITFQREALMLLRLMDCEALARTGTLAEIVNKLKPDPPSPLQDAANQGMGPDGIPLEALRTTYLEKLAQLHQVATLPLTPLVSYSFDKIYQPLQLRQSPFVAEDLIAGERRALLDEPTRGEHDPRRAWSELAEGYPPERWLSVPAVVIANDLEEALTQSKGRVMVLGSPGTGKTTLLKTHTSTMAKHALKDASARLPIYLALSRHIGSPPTLRACLSIMLDALGIDERYADVLLHEIQQGRACVCVDGLDELPFDRRETVIGWIRGRAPEPGNVWVVASRFADYRLGQFRREGFVEWELRPLTSDKRHALVGHLIPEIARQMLDNEVPTGYNAGAFLKRLETHPYISTWGNNPLMLSLAAVVFLSTGSIPSSRAELYRRIIDAVLERRPVDQHRLETLRETASFLALTLVQQQRRTLTEAQLLSILHGRWPSRDEELAAGLVHMGLLEVVAKGIFGYWHYTYQEYFAAEALAKRLTSEDPGIRERTRALLEEKWIERQWGEPLRLLVGILVSKGDGKGVQIALAWLRWLLNQHLQPGGAEVGNLALALAIQSLGEIGPLPQRSLHTEWQQLEQDAAQAWVQALLRATDQCREAQQERLLAVAEEIGHFTPSLIQNLVQRLTVSFTLQPARIRAAVIAALGKLGPHAPVDILAQALGDRHEQVREAVVRAWVELGTDAPRDRLVAALHSERVAVRLTATRILGELRQPALLNHLLAVLRDEERSIREAAVVAIGNLKMLDAVQYLRKSLRDKEEFVQLAAVEALGKLSGKIAERPLLALLKDDAGDSVRAKVIQVLGKQAPVAEVIEELKCPPSYRPYSLAYHAAVEALRECDERELARARAKGLGKNDPAIWDTIQALREAQQEPSTEELVAFLGGHDLDRCYAAADLLGRRNEWESLEQFLISLEAGKNGYVRAIAARLLGRLGEETPVHLLVTALTDTSPTVRLATLQAFVEMEDRTPPEAAAAVSLLNDQDSKICAAAMRVVANVSEHIIVDVPVLETLFLASEHPDKPMRQAALLCLRKLEKRVTDEQFAAILRHEDSSIRLQAVKRFGQYDHTDQILQVGRDMDPRIRTAALEMIADYLYLYKGKVEELQELLNQVLKDETPSVRDAAARVHKLLGVWRLLAPISPPDEEGRPVDQPVTTPYWDWWRTTSADEEGGPVDQRASTANPSAQSKKSPRRMKRWGDSYLKMLSMTLDPEPLKRSAPGPNEELFPMEEAERGQIRKRTSEGQLRTALESNDAGERLRALQVLAERTPEEYLKATLDDEEPSIRRKAFQLLAERTSTDLLAGGLSDDHPIVRAVATHLLRQRRARISDQELHILLESHSGVARASVITALEERIPQPLLVAALGDSEEAVRLAAFDALRRAYPETLPVILSELTAVLTGTGLGSILIAAAESFIADLMVNMEHVPAQWLEKLTQLLGASYWEVRAKAAQALSTLRRGLPQEAIDHLRALRRDPESQAVQMAADDALTEVLSCERDLL